MLRQKKGPNFFERYEAVVVGEKGKNEGWGGKKGRFFQRDGYDFLGETP